jgi:hypothetical protein
VQALQAHFWQIGFTFSFFLPFYAFGKILEHVCVSSLLGKFLKVFTERWTRFAGGNGRSDRGLYRIGGVV